MTPEYILTKSLCRPAYCGDSEYFEPDEAKRRANDIRSALREIENLGYAREYAEPGYTNPKRGILFANWNCFPRGIDSLLERYGYEVEWSDEWATCDGCSKAVRTEPDGWDWSPSYEYVEGEGTYCKDCGAAD
jgi:hypothetical protein